MTASKLGTQFVKIVLLAAVLYFVGATIIERVADVEWNRLRPDFRFLALAMLAAISARFFIGIFYGVLLRHLDNPLPYRIGMAVSWMALLGKYVPGKMAIFASVVCLLARYQVNAAVSVIVPMLNNGMAVLIALILSLPLLFSSWARETIPFSRVWFIMLIVAGIVALCPRVFLGTCNFFLRLMKRPRLDVNLTFRQMILPVCFVTGQCLATGVATWCMARTLSPSVDLYSMPLMVSVTALAGALGILALFAPAGLGVVEGMYLLMLSPLIGPEMAALLSICLRLLQTAADILMAFAGMLFVARNPLSVLTETDS